MGLTALWWWIDRWRKSTAYTDMTLEEQGAYRNLLDEAHLRGGYLPADERILAKACGDALAWSRVRVAVLAKFTSTDRGYYNETLALVLQESERRADKQRRYRERLGNDRGNKHSNAHGNGDGNSVTVVTRYQDQDQDQEPSQGLDQQKEKKKAVAAPLVLTPGSEREKNYRIIVKIAHEVMNQNGRRADADAIEMIKRLCARRHIAYDSAIVRKALDSAEAQRRA